jgi:hypothetical protein
VRKQREQRPKPTPDLLYGLVIDCHCYHIHTPKRAGMSAGALLACPFGCPCMPDLGIRMYEESLKIHCMRGLLPDGPSPGHRALEMRVFFLEARPPHSTKGV